MLLCVSWHLPREQTSLTRLEQSSDLSQSRVAAVGALEKCVSVAWQSHKVMEMGEKERVEGLKVRTRVILLPNRESRMLWG